MYPIGAPRLVVTTNVHVSQASNAVVVETFNDLDGIEAHEHVVMPSMSVSVHEYDGVGKFIVVIDEIGEVDL